MGKSCGIPTAHFRFALRIGCHFMWVLAINMGRRKGGWSTIRQALKTDISNRSDEENFTAPTCQESYVNTS